MPVEIPQLQNSDIRDSSEPPLLEPSCLMGWWSLPAGRVLPDPVGEGVGRPSGPGIPVIPGFNFGSDPRIFMCRRGSARGFVGSGGGRLGSQCGVSLGSRAGGLGGLSAGDHCSVSRGQAGGLGGLSVRDHRGLSGQAGSCCSPG